jgi:23S rRNA (pseudouridine1915-N3)-methyltransferase
MRLLLVSVGRTKAGPERELSARYMDRARATGRPMGFTTIDLREIDESRARRPEDRKAEEARGIRAEVSAGASLIVFDEGGKGLSSRAFASELAARRDRATSLTVLAIGGPDGLAEPLRASASLVLSLGMMTFPHRMVQILAAEQIYRAMTILAGHPYHRG